MADPKVTEVDQPRTACPVAMVSERVAMPRRHMRWLVTDMTWTCLQCGRPMLLERTQTDADYGRHFVAHHQPVRATAICQSGKEE